MEPLKFWLHNSCTKAPKQRPFAQKWGIVSERNLLIPNDSVWNREFAKPLYWLKPVPGVRIPPLRQTVLEQPVQSQGEEDSHGFPRYEM